MSIPGGWVAGLGLVFGVALVGTWLARRYALSRRLIDQPGERRSHSTATPRGGGIAIVAAMLVALALAEDATRVLSVAMALGLLLVAAVGWVDDHRPLSPWMRLAVHALAAACLGVGLHAEGASPGIVAVGVVLALVLTNVWNFMDGIDGLAVSQALLVALGCALLAWGGPAAWLPLALAAACAGFLPFNLPPARIFLGDVGSGTLGYLLAGLLASAALRDASEALLLLLPLCAFLVDASLTLARRVLAGERWWLPHTQHAYQRWVRACGRHGVVTGAYAAWTVVMLLNLRWASGGSSLVKITMLGGWYLAGAITWTWLQRTPHLTGDRE